MSPHPAPTLALAALALLLAGNALAWTPYGEPPPEPWPGQAGPPGYGPPGYDPYRYGPLGFDPIGTGMPPAEALPPPMPTTAPPVPTATGPVPSRPGTPAPERPAVQPRPGSLRQQRTAAAYTLDIVLGGPLGAAQVQVEPAGHGLLVRIDQTLEQRREQHPGDRRGWQRSWRWSSGTLVRRLPVPADGDLAAMTRTDGPDAVHIVIPRRPAPAARPGAARPNATPAPPPGAAILPETQP